MTAERPSSRRFSVAQLALIVPLVALVIGAWEPIGDNSFLWHVRAGELQATTGAVIQTDPFSFTRGGEAWLTQSWLVELFYAWAEDITTLGFVPWMILVVGAVTFLGLGLVGYRHSRSVPGTVFVLVLSTIALLSFLVPRPVIFSYMLMVLMVLAWDSPKTRWAVPLIIWIWASVHGSFLIGLAYIGLTLVMNREWRWLPTAAIAGIATLFTAHGLGVIEFLAHFTANRDALEFISEWRKPELLEAVFLPVTGGMAFIVIGAYRGLIRPSHLWLIVPFLLLGLSALRAIPPAWIALVPLISTSLAGLTLGAASRIRAPVALIYAGAVLLIPLTLLKDSALADDRFPIRALPHLEDVPTFHDDRAGGFLIWAVGPEWKVYVDDRAELYGPRLEEFVKVRIGEADWEAVFSRDGVEQALISNRDEELIERIKSGGWRTSYSDEHYTILRP